jgi:hypothetical protein
MDDEGTPGVQDTCTARTKEDLDLMDEYEAEEWEEELDVAIRGHSELQDWKTL